MPFQEYILNLFIFLKETQAKELKVQQLKISLVTSSLILFRINGVEFSKELCSDLLQISHLP